MTLVTLRSSAFIIAGALLGLLHFAALRRAVSVRLQQRCPRLGLHSARFASTAIGLLVVTRAGGKLGLLASYLGFVAARAFATVRRRSA